METNAVNKLIASIQTDLPSQGIPPASSPPSESFESVLSKAQSRPDLVTGGPELEETDFQQKRLNLAAKISDKILEARNSPNYQQTLQELDDLQDQYAKVNVQAREVAERGVREVFARLSAPPADALASIKMGRFALRSQKTAPAAAAIPQKNSKAAAKISPSKTEPGREVALPPESSNPHTERCSDFDGNGFNPCGPALKSGPSPAEHLHSDINDIHTYATFAPAAANPAAAVSPAQTSGPVFQGQLPADLSPYVSMPSSAPASFSFSNDPGPAASSTTSAGASASPISASPGAVSPGAPASFSNSTPAASSSAAITSGTPASAPSVPTAVSPASAPGGNPALFGAEATSQSIPTSNSLSSGPPAGNAAPSSASAPVFREPTTGSRTSPAETANSFVRPGTSSVRPGISSGYFVEPSSRGNMLQPSGLPKPAPVTQPAVPASTPATPIYSTATALQKTASPQPPVLAPVVVPPVNIPTPFVIIPPPSAPGLVVPDTAPGVVINMPPAAPPVPAPVVKPAAPPVNQKPAVPVKAVVGNHPAQRPNPAPRERLVPDPILRPGNVHVFAQPPAESGLSKTIAAENAFFANTAALEGPSNSFGVSPDVWETIQRDANLKNALASLPENAVVLYRETPRDLKLQFLEHVKGETQVLWYTISHRRAFVDGRALGRNTFDYLLGSLGSKAQELMKTGKISADALALQQTGVGILKSLAPTQREAYVSLLEAEAAATAAG